MNKSSRHKKTPSRPGDRVSDNVNLLRKNVMSDNSTAVTVDNLPAISHEGRPVVTTALLAKLYGTDDHNIIKNYNANDGRFIAGKHFHKLEGAELKAFKNNITQSDVVNKHARQLILWTERGAARHAKMLDTEAAWEVFEKLEDSYFVAASAAEPVTGEQKSLDLGQEAPSMLNSRWLLCFDDVGNQQVIPVPSDAAVLTKKQFLKGIFFDGDIPLSTDEMFDCVIAGITQLKGRHHLLKAMKSRGEV